MRPILRTAAVIARKEFIGGLRDRRSLISAFLFPLLGPVILLFTFSSISEVVGDEKPLTMKVSGDQAPDLAAFLSTKGVRVERFDGDVERAFEDETIDFLVRVPKGFSDALTEARKVDIELLSDPSRGKSRARARRAKHLLSKYSTQVTRDRMRARGLDPSLADPFRIMSVSMAKDHNPLKDALSLIGTFLLIAGYIGGMYLAMDITTGERERGSLEALLSTAAPRMGIVLGKSTAIGFFALGSTVVTLTLFFLVMTTLPMDKLGVAVNLNVGAWAICLVLFLPWIITVSALQHFVGTVARSIKEAQMILSIVMLAPMAPALFFTLNPGSGGLALWAIPGIGQQTLVLDYLTGADIGAVGLFVSVGTSLAVSALALWAGHRCLDREKVLFVR